MGFYLQRDEKGCISKHRNSMLEPEYLRGRRHNSVNEDIDYITVACRQNGWKERNANYLRKLEGHAVSGWLGKYNDSVVGLKDEALDSGEQKDRFKSNYQMMF